MCEYQLLSEGLREFSRRRLTRILPLDASFLQSSFYSKYIDKGWFT